MTFVHPSGTLRRPIDCASSANPLPSAIPEFQKETFRPSIVSPLMPSQPVATQSCASASCCVL